jgi:ABC-type multidrug transport system fused ATPase/permease subunit
MVHVHVRPADAVEISWSFQVIIIAHKLETIQTANRILFMEDGRIVEQGTHLELLERGGRYASFYQTQQRSERL